MASATQNEATVRKGYEYFNSGNMEELRKLFAPEATWHVPGRSRFAGDKQGVDASFAYFGEIVQATDMTFRAEVHDIVANEQHAVGLHTTTATRNGKELRAHTVLVFHMNGEGKIDECWEHFDDTATVDEFWA